ncbi:MAG: hypothetical protein INR69_04100 [Mucilaginibacter polytrichastri]|nr:hypothetical protein [Mucilaginibacter polytrichastri]
MRFIIVHAPWLRAHAMAVYPFVLIREKAYRNQPVLINHEKIHLRQELEMLILPFYAAYFTHYFYNRLRGMKHDAAYRHIIFEREAYKHENNPDYLRSRQIFGWRFA